MKRIRPALLICLFSATFFSCRKNYIQKIDYVIFGRYYFRCGGGEACIEFFKIEGSTLSEDTLDRYPHFNKQVVASFVRLSNDKYHRVKNLAQRIPSQLYDYHDNVIGMPDAGDWGGNYLELRRNGSRRFWYIDTKKMHIPSSLHDFVDKLNAAVDTLQ